MLVADIMLGFCGYETRSSNALLAPFVVVRSRQGSHDLAPFPFPQFKCGTRCRDVHTLGPYGCRVALQINSCCTMPVSAALGRACGVEWSTHARHVARASKPKRPVVTGVAMPGHRHTRRGCFCIKGASLNDRGAGDPLRRFYYASERSRSGTWRPTQAHREL